MLIVFKPAAGIVMLRRIEPGRGSEIPKRRLQTLNPMSRYCIEQWSRNAGDEKSNALSFEIFYIKCKISLHGKHWPPDSLGTVNVRHRRQWKYSCKIARC